jgi:hypothetical protein
VSDPPTVPADRQAYHDTYSRFSIRLSPTWTVVNYSGSSNFLQEILSFSDPGLGNASPWIDIYANPMGNASARHQYCQQIRGIPTYFHGLPARFDFQGGWLLETANAHFKIDAAIRPYPKALGIDPPPPTPTPLPPDTAAADQTLIDTMLGFFQPTDPHALSCP